MFICGSSLQKLEQSPFSNFHNLKSFFLTFSISCFSSSSVIDLCLMVILCFLYDDTNLHNKNIMCKLLKKLFCLLSYLFQIVQNHPDSFVRVYFHYRHIIEYGQSFLHVLPYAILQCAQGDSQVEAVLDKTFPCRVQCKIMPYTYFKSQVLHFPCQSIITAHISSVFAKTSFPVFLSIYFMIRGIASSGM